MADSDGFKCPRCKTNHTIAELELWEVYEEDSKKTEITCGSCDIDIIITSEIVAWKFSVEIK